MLRLLPQIPRMKSASLSSTALSRAGQNHRERWHTGCGFDSDVRCIIYARPTKSEIRWVQCLGRGLRKAQGKDKCLIFDHSGSVHRLGFPDDIEYDELRVKVTAWKNHLLSVTGKAGEKAEGMYILSLHEACRCLRLPEMRL